MTNNPTIDGVSRERVEAIAREMDRLGYGHHESHAESILRALLDAKYHPCPVLLDGCDGSCAPSVERQETMQMASMPVERCTSCDDSGDLTDMTGEWRGYCVCPIGEELKNKPNATPEVAALQSTIARLEARITQLESEVEFAAATYQAARERIAELESGQAEAPFYISVDDWNMLVRDDVEIASVRVSRTCRSKFTEPLFTAPPAPVATVPDGWKLVPVEPTAEMLENLAAEIYPDDKEAGLRLQRLRGTNVVFPKHEIEMAVGKYARMLDASPACLDATAALNGPDK